MDTLCITSDRQDFLEWLVVREGRIVSFLKEVTFGSEDPHFKFQTRHQDGILSNIIERYAGPFTVYRRRPSEDLQSRWRRVWTNESSSKDEIII